MTCLRTGAFANSIRDSSSALVVLPTPEAIAQGIEQLWVNPKERREKILAGLKYVRMNYDQAQSRKQFLHLALKLEGKVSFAPS